jgi:hypothetical protein
MLPIHRQKYFPVSLPFIDKLVKPSNENLILPRLTIHAPFIARMSGPVGIAGRRRPTIPNQAFNLTQTTTFNPNIR